VDRTDIQQLFQKFAAPLGQYVVLGGRQGAAETLARNLWLAMLAGPEAEEEVWRAMGAASGADAGLLESLRQCYLSQMKPAVGQDQLDNLRKHYQISSDEDEAAGDGRHEA
jgi:hypothetical protein